MFLYPVIKEGNGDTVFIFTGDANGRPDYVHCIRKVKTQCDYSVLYIMDRTKPQFIINHIFSFVSELIWAVKLNSINHDFNISFDMAVGLYRAKKQGEYIYKIIGNARRIYGTMKTLLHKKQIGIKCLLLHFNMVMEPIFCTVHVVITILPTVS